MVFEILAFLCFAIFAQKFENSKWPPFLARGNFFENWHGYSAEIPSGSKISSKSLYLARFSRYKHFCVLQFCEKFENSKWPPFFARNFLFENWHGYSAEIPCGSKISRSFQTRSFHILCPHVGVGEVSSGEVGVTLNIFVTDKFIFFTDHRFLLGFFIWI